MSGWRLVGLNDDATSCDVCGRVELKATMHLVHEDGSELRAGTTCGARKLGIAGKRTTAAVKAYRMHLEIRRGAWVDYFRQRFNVRSTTELMRDWSLTEEAAITFQRESWARYCAEHPIEIAL